MIDMNVVDGLKKRLIHEKEQEQLKYEADLERNTKAYTPILLAKALIQIEQLGSAHLKDEIKAIEQPFSIDLLASELDKLGYEFADNWECIGYAPYIYWLSSIDFYSFVHKDVNVKNRDFYEKKNKEWGDNGKAMEKLKERFNDVCERSTVIKPLSIMIYCIFVAFAIIIGLVIAKL